MSDERRANGTFVRRGNGAGHGPAAGAGYGGPARGAGKPQFGAANRPSKERRTLTGKIKAAVAREIAAGHVPQAVEVWRKVMMDPTAPPMARIVAAEKMVERAEGKAEQNLNVSSLDGISDDQLAAAIAALAEAAAAEDAGGAGEAGGAEPTGNLSAVH